MPQQEFFSKQDIKLLQQAKTNNVIIDIIGYQITSNISNPNSAFIITKANTLAGGNDNQIKIIDASKGLYEIYINAVESGNMIEGIWKCTTQLVGTQSYTIITTFYIKNDVKESNYNIQIEANIGAAGDGLVVDNSGERYSVNVDNNTIIVNANNQLEVKDNSITNNKLTSGIDGSKITNTSVTNDKLASGIDAAKIADGTVTNNDFKSLSGLNNTSISNYMNTETSQRQNADTVLSNRITSIETEIPLGGIQGDIVGTQNTQVLTNKTIDATLNTVTNINTNNIVNNAITTDKINNNAVTEAKIADGSITTNKIANSSINSTKLADNAVTISKIANNNVSIQKLELIDNGKLITSDGIFNKTVVMSGDVSMDNNGVTFIGEKKITSSKLADNITIKNLTVQPSTDGDGIFNICSQDGTVLLKVNTTTKRIIAQNGMKFEGDGSLLTNILSVGTGGTSSTGDLQLIANSDSSAGGVIKLMVGNTVVGRIKGDSSATKGIFEINETPANTALLTPTSTAVGLGARSKELVRIDDTGRENIILTNGIYNSFGGYSLLNYNSYIRIPYNNILDEVTDNLSIEFFVLYYPISYVCLFVSYGGTNNDKYEVYTLNSKVYFSIKTSTGTYTINDDQPLSAGMYHIVCTYDGTNMRIYINNYLKKTGNATGNLAQSNSQIVLGTVESASKFSSHYMFLLRLYNFAIPQNEIKNLYYNTLNQLNVDRLYISQPQGLNNIITNGGAIGATDWVDTNSDGLADNVILYVGSNTANIVTGNGFTGNAQRVNKGGGSYIHFGLNHTLVANKIYIAQFKYRSDGNFNINSNYFTNYSGIIPANTGNAIPIKILFLSYANESVRFITDSTPTYIEIDEVIVRQVGCIAEYLPRNAGKFGWLETQNQIHTVNMNTAIQLSKGIIYRDVKTLVTGNTTLTNVIPKKYMLKQIIVENTTANAYTLNIGTTSNGTDVANGVAVGSNALVTINVNKMYSMTTDQTLYAWSSAWNGSRSNIYFIMEAI